MRVLGLRAPRAMREQGRMWAFAGLLVVFGLVSVVRTRSFSNAANQISDSTFDSDSETLSLGRRLKGGEDASCVQLKSWERQYGLAVYILALLYLFISLATVCDEYFVDALELITAKLHLSPDVAGATFMAAGSSAPELFVSISDNVLTKPKESMGVGAIVGSAIFNILVIISLAAFFAGQVLVLDWRPLIRDGLWYCYAILLLTAFIWDGKVETWEAGVLFVSYILYCLYMSINEKVINRCCKRPEIEVEDEDEEEEAAKTENLGETQAQAHGPSMGVPMLVGLAAQRFKAKTKKYTPQINPMLLSEYRPRLSYGSSSSSSRRLSRPAPEVTEVDPNVSVPLPPTIQEDPTNPTTSDEPLEPYFQCLWTMPESVVGKIWFVITWPVRILLRVTVPDTRYPQFSGTWGLVGSFVMSILWICGLSNFTVSWATKVGCLLHIPSTVMGLTIVAMGTSVPDALSSVLVARSGKGDMAVSNAIGSNCFDILCGLGLPLLLSTLIYHEAATVAVDNLQTSIFMLFGVLIAVILLLAVSKWRLHPIVGGIMAVMYVLYVVYSYLHEA
jgi:K+-dependent Na+/Ca+ exchanger-like protein